MTPQERQQVEELFERLAAVEKAPRDAEATAAISAGLARAPNALYALVQTVLVQDEALRRANARIEELTGAPPAGEAGGSFLDSMRDAIWGRTGSRGSVPSVPSASPSRPGVWNSGQAAPWPSGAPGAAPSGHGSFLGTAAAAAAGVIGGSLLLGGIRSMMGGTQHGFGPSDALGRDRKDPWEPSTDRAPGGDLARDAGIDDIGRGGGRASFLDNPANANDDFASLDADNFNDSADLGGDFDSGEV
jgi:hypothetical protein